MDIELARTVKRQLAPLKASRHNQPRTLFSGTKTMFRYGILALLLSTLPVLSYAAFRDGNKLRSWVEADDRIAAGTHQRSDLMQGGQFSGYVTGVFDSTEPIYCGTGNITVGQVGAIVKKYLADHPERWAESGDAIVTSALMKAFPCPKK